MTRTAPVVLPKPVVIKAEKVDPHKYRNGTLARMSRANVKFSDS